MVALDFIGYGFSSKPTDYQYTTFDQADLVEGLLESLGIGQTHILAHDYGDTVAQELLARRIDEPRREFVIQSVCLLNGGLFVEAIRPRRIQKLLLTPLGPLLSRLFNRRSFRRSFRPLFGPRTQPRNDELDAFWSLITFGGGKRVIFKLIRYLKERAAYRERWVAALANSAAPLRFLVGTEDPVSGHPMAERYRELIPNPDVVLLKGIGHYPQVEDPEAVLREFSGFVEKL